MDLPEYHGNSIVNLMASIQRHFSQPSAVEPLSTISPNSFGDASTIVIFVADGLGYQYLTTTGKDTFLAKHITTKITSVFPTTTAAAMTSIYTGLTPQNHACLAWFLYLKELGVLSAIIPFHIRGSKLPIASKNVTPNMIYRNQSIFSTLSTKNFVIMPRDLVKSPYNTVFGGPAQQIGYNSMKDMFQFTQNLILNQVGKNVILVYFPDLDSLCHDAGVAHEKVLVRLQEFDEQFLLFMEKIKTKLNSTKVIVTADHGLIDCPKEKLILLENHPKLVECLTMPLCGEPRAVFCYVRPSKTAEFEKYISDHLSHACECVKTENMVAQGYFGYGTPHLRFFDRVGDYVLLMKENYILKDQVLGEVRRDLIGNHGGLSPDELYVPLILL